MSDNSLGRSCVRECFDIDHECAPLWDICSFFSASLDQIKWRNIRDYNFFFSAGLGKYFFLEKCFHFHSLGISSFDSRRGVEKLTLIQCPWVRRWWRPAPKHPLPFLPQPLWNDEWMPHNFPFSFFFFNLKKRGIILFNDFGQ